MRSLKKQARDLLDRIRRGSEYSIENDPFDLENFNNIKERSKSLLESEEKGLEEYEPFPELMQDTFDALFKNTPEVLPDWRMKPKFLLNREIAQKLLESARYKELRVMTQLDDLASALGTEIMAEQLREWIKERKEQQQALQDLIDAAGEVAGAAEEGDGDDAEKPPGQKGKATEQISLEEAMKRYDEAMKKFETSTNEKKFVQGIERIAAEVKDEVRETTEMISNWGLERSDTYSRQPVNEKMELLNRLRSSDKLREMARMAGRLRRMALQVRRERVKKGLDETYSITQGNDISRLVPSELMRFLNPDTKKKFYADFIEGKTLMYEIRGREKKARGPIIIAIDSSGSMYGLPEIWSKSVALALLEIARDQKRDFFVIHFSSGARMDQLKTNQFLKDNQFEVEEMLDMAEYFEGGGTEFEPPLDLARKMIGEEKAWSKADVIFVTDGESAVRQDWVDDFNAWKKENKVSIYSILIDSRANTSVVLDLFSDKVELLNDMKQQDTDDLAISIFTSI